MPSLRGGVAGSERRRLLMAATTHRRGPMRTHLARLVLLLLLVAPASLPAQSAIVPPGSPTYKPPRLPPPNGFRVYITDDIEGLGSVVQGSEVGGPPGSDYWEHYRDLLTQEVNAVIAGARRGGGRDFVVHEGPRGSSWASILPW